MALTHFARTREWPLTTQGQHYCVLLFSSPTFNRALGSEIKQLGRVQGSPLRADVGVNKKDGSLFEVILNFRHCQDAMIMLRICAWFNQISAALEIGERDIAAGRTVPYTPDLLKQIE